MSLLTISPEHQPDQGLRYAEFADISAQLQTIGVVFERWEASCQFAADADQATVLAAYAEPIARLQNQYGFRSVDVISLTAAHPDKVALRQKFLAEHTHDDFEVRFFVEGCGLFYLHMGDKVYSVLCCQGDLISVPAHTRHWFDLGAEPQLKAIRLFTTPDGWVATFTGSDIGAGYPTLDQTLAGLS